MIRSGRLRPDRLTGRTISLAESIDRLVNLDRSTEIGVTVINEF